MFRALYLAALVAAVSTSTYLQQYAMGYSPLNTGLPSSPSTFRIQLPCGTFHSGTHFLGAAGGKLWVTCNTELSKIDLATQTLTHEPFPGDYISTAAEKIVAIADHNSGEVRLFDIESSSMILQFAKSSEYDIKYVVVDSSYDIYAGPSGKSSLENGVFGVCYEHRTIRPLSSGVGVVCGAPYEGFSIYHENNNVFVETTGSVAAVTSTGKGFSAIACYEREGDSGEPVVETFDAQGTGVNYTTPSLGTKSDEPVTCSGLSFASYENGTVVAFPNVVRFEHSSPPCLFKGEPYVPYHRTGEFVQFRHAATNSIHATLPLKINELVIEARCDMAGNVFATTLLPSGAMFISKIGAL